MSQTSSEPRAVVPEHTEPSSDTPSRTQHCRNAQTYHQALLQTVLMIPRKGRAHAPRIRNLLQQPECRRIATITYEERPASSGNNCVYRFKQHTTEIWAIQHVRRGSQTPQDDIGNKIGDALANLERSCKDTSSVRNGYRITVSNQISQINY
eukprot:TRINITY_DN3743_c0_g1_i8.p1 TRINITY_DN3743_c0_g1~~TRINITY_DN3743_c0_g1_i8.p1  ORF type:complete len:173 (-),score=0.08 TRINITY_DN3743_c0_g1_i8:47-502(-)